VHILPCFPVSYLTLALQIPWGQHTPDNYSITQAQKVLDEDHHSLKHVKDRILEFLPFLSVTTGEILLLVALLDVFASCDCAIALMTELFP
jgi:ATP-dependent Lon protease